MQHEVVWVLINCLVNNGSRCKSLSVTGWLKVVCDHICYRAWVCCINHTLSKWVLQCVRFWRVGPVTGALLRVNHVSTTPFTIVVFHVLDSVLLYFVLERMILGCVLDLGYKMVCLIWACAGGIFVQMSSPPRFFSITVHLPASLQVFGSWPPIFSFWN